MFSGKKKYFIIIGGLLAIAAGALFLINNLSENYLLEKFRKRNDEF